jgi:hypothetical protein
MNEIENQSSCCAKQSLDKCRLAAADLAEDDDIGAGQLALGVAGGT